MFGRLTPVVKYLLLVNIGLFFISYFLFAFYKIDLTDFLGLHYIFSEKFLPFQIITFAFMHAFEQNGSLYFWHIFGNMFGLFIFGPILERFWGPKKFLLFYLVTGIGSGIIFSAVEFIEIRPLQKQTHLYTENPNSEDFTSFVIEHKVYQFHEFADLYEEDPSNPQFTYRSTEMVKAFYRAKSNIPLVGASGALFGILLAFAMLFPNTELMLLFLPIPIKAKYFVLFYGLYEAYALFQNSPTDNVAHLAHLGGMLIGFIMLKMWQGQRNSFY